ncbi:Lrp/AsnC family transcriptional regulator [Sciscionella sediminilitoris]|uniref:Lrp/AsnC family transcriptional regulator n=1 Tax=Sciscionella sediminilitoris TaxID=1445613 RepID=UPI0009E8F777|nr:Lrp/AsnC family transcriptional regulator [Sciscionella sp. SE31]
MSEPGLPEVSAYDEADLAILHALQVNPRATWNRIARTIGLDPGTVGRRWARLRDSGQAWVTAYPGKRDLERLCFSFVEVRCTPGRIGEVADVLAGDPRVLTVEYTSGSRDLLLTVLTGSTDGLSRFLEELGPLELARTQSQVVSTLHQDGSRWRLSSLTTAQQQALLEPRAVTPVESRPYTEAERVLIRELSKDGRRSYTELAGVLGTSVNTVRRTMETLLGQGKLTLRCELSKEWSGWPVSAVVWVSAPPDRAGETARLVAGMRHSRLVAGITGGQATMLCALWLRTPAELQRFESELTGRVPGLRILDRSIALRPPEADGPAARRVRTPRGHRRAGALETLSPPHSPAASLPPWNPSPAPGRRCAPRSPNSATRTSPGPRAAPAGSSAIWCVTWSSTPRMC